MLVIHMLGLCTCGFTHGCTCPFWAVHSITYPFISQQDPSYCSNYTSYTVGILGCAFVHLSLYFTIGSGLLF